MFVQFRLLDAGRTGREVEDLLSAENKGAERVCRAVPALVLPRTRVGRRLTGYERD